MSRWNSAKNTSKNCSALKAPKLNAELKLNLSPTSVARDNYLSTFQNGIGAALSALGAAFSQGLTGENSDSMRTMNRALGDAGRILTNVHFEISTSRRAFIYGGLKGLAKSVAKNTSIDTYLFGEKLAEQFKNAQTLEKAGKDLTKSGFKQSQPQNKQGSSHHSSLQKNSKPQAKKNYSSKSSNRRGDNKFQTSKNHQRSYRRN